MSLRVGAECAAFRRHRATGSLPHRHDALYRRRMAKGYLDIDDDVAALATAPGKGALAVVRLSGPGCIERLAAVFSRPDVLAHASGGSAVVGKIVSLGRAVDEVVAVVFRSPASYTGQDSVDVMCHGGLVVPELVMTTLVDAGFRRALPGEFTFRAFQNGKMDLARAEAVNELVAAGTATSRADAFARLSGGLSRELGAIRDRLVRVAAACALRLDYGEDEQPEPLETALPDIEAALDACRQLAATYETGRILRDGATVTLLGRTNAGKSSLYNRLLREERAIVSDRHGTTRDYIEAGLDFGGIPVRLFDTAGVRDSDDPVESEGVRRSHLVAEGADIVVYVVDAVQGFSAVDLRFVDAHPEAVCVWNKVDAPGALPAPDGWLAVSALTGQGEADLVVSVRSRLTGSNEAIAGAVTRIGTDRHRQALLRAAEALSDAIVAVRAGEPVDVVSLDVASALEAVGEITGETTSEDVLESLFSSFCVGK